MPSWCGQGQFVFKGKDKVVSVHNVKTIEGVEVWLQFFYAWHWMEVSCQLHVLVTLPLGKELHGTH